MNWRSVLQRTNLILGLVSLVLAVWGGTHLQGARIGMSRG